uniref:NADH-ubiquinone oxidoreductase chain 4 n=1 Tax=Stenocephus fraxini TaxID=2963023 RepID=A0A9E8Z1W1_9HYME|nr:NADH dehydrogenase subunit 4 [Stenocephus fraxini]WAK85076.1 NADH dehydrogenase subunit 4 [Stenocephus fraxini]
MLKYFIIIMLMITFLIFLSMKNFMLNILFKNIILFLMIIFLIECNFVSLNLIDYTYIYFMFGLDNFSYWLIVLSMWIIFLMVLASIKIVKNNNFLLLFILNLSFMLIFLMMVFSVLNFMTFYFLFEASLIPTLFLILGWGYQIERIQAGYYMMFYTLFTSLPLLMVLIFFYNTKYSLDMIFMSISKYNLHGNVFIYLLMLMAFLVKLPMFMVHLWLPKAHVEAPVSGSMILAGVMLKLGGYGLYRVLLIIEMDFSSVNLLIVVFSLMGGIYMSFLCFRQVDMKSLVAYSSVVHMSLVIGGLLSVEFMGINGAYLMMISHGICSSGLFCVVNMFYERSMSRSLFINKGFLIFSPSMMIMWFLLCMGNMSAPPSLNMLSEIFLLISLLGLSKMLIIVLMVLLFVSSCYSLYLYSYICYGKSLNMFSFYMFSSREYFLMLLHLVPLNFLILKIDLFL